MQCNVGNLRDLLYVVPLCVCLCGYSSCTYVLHCIFDVVSFHEFIVWKIFRSKC
jgi:hypothetical protein